MLPRFAPVLLALTVLLHADPLKYPETKKGGVVEMVHSTQIADPYRWLEDDNSSETKAWVEAQNKVTFGFLEQIPEREKIRARG